MPAEEVRLELGAQEIRVEVLDGAGLGIAAIVEQCVETTAGLAENALDRDGDRGLVGVVEL